MPTDLTVRLEDRPGRLVDLGEAPGISRVNIDEMCGFPSGGMGVVRMLVVDGKTAREALETAGLNVSGEREVIVHEAENKPGMLGQIARKLADACVNLNLIHKATQTRLAIGADDLEKARAAL
jgi:hypothetical protein